MPVVDSDKLATKVAGVEAGENSIASREVRIGVCSYRTSKITDMLPTAKSRCASLTLCVGYAACAGFLIDVSDPLPPPRSFLGYTFLPPSSSLCATPSTVVISARMRLPNSTRRRLSPSISSPSALVGGQNREAGIRHGLHPSTHSSFLGTHALSLSPPRYPCTLILPLRCVSLRCNLRG